MEQRGGYTLIELIVVITLLTGLSTVLLLNSSDSKTLSQLDTATRQLESALMQAQAFGNSGKAFPEGTTEFDSGYGVYVEQNSGTILMYGGQGDDDGDGTIEPDEERYTTGNEYETIVLQGGVVVSDIDTSMANNRPNAQVLFRRGESEAHIHSNNQDSLDSMTITLEKDGFTKQVLVYKTGLVYSE